MYNIILGDPGAAFTGESYTVCTRVYGVYEGIQGVLEYTGYTRVYRAYKVF